MLRLKGTRLGGQSIRQDRRQTTPLHVQEGKARERDETRERGRRGRDHHGGVQEWSNTMVVRRGAGLGLRLALSSLGRGV